MAPKPRYMEGEKVLCFHGPLLYEAKCLKSQVKQKHMEYFIHYSGWNKNWDEWVPECRVLKYNETNLKKQKELIKTHVKSKKSKTVKASIKKEGEKEPLKTNVPEKTVKPKPEKKVSVSALPEDPPENQVETKVEKRPCVEPRFLDEVQPNTEINIVIPDLLKDWLVDDWDLINRQRKILSLPARITVDHVIASFIQEKVSMRLSSFEERTVIQVANKIRDVFNVLLGKSLLYKFERQQYAEILSTHQDYSMCQIYGAIHLLRMFTQMKNELKPFLSSEINSLVGYINDFTRFFSENSNFFSLGDYVVATPEYHRRAL